MLLIMAGLPGTGKSALAGAIAQHTGAFVLDKDKVREALFPPELVEYSRQQDDFIVRIMLKVAGWIVRGQPAAVVVLDGRPFSKKYQLDQVIAFAEWIKTPWKIVECTCPEETARQRLEGAPHPAKDRDFGLYRRVKEEWEEIGRPKLVVDTARPLREITEQTLAYIGARDESNQQEKMEL